MTLEQVLALLRRRCDEAGSQSAWAKGAGVSLPYVNDVLNGRREPGDGILKPLGLEKVVSYRKVVRFGPLASIKETPPSRGLPAKRRKIASDAP